MTTTKAVHDVLGHAYGPPPECYQRYFVPVIGRPFAEDLIEEAVLQPGDRVLDIACGTGVVARLAAERVGPGGTVTALDVNPAMLSAARAIPTSGAEIRWLETTAESMPLPDAAFDVVLCQFGLQFVPDRIAALREMRRVLSPAGRALVSTPPPSAFFDVLGKALARHVGGNAAGFANMVFALADPLTIERLFRDAGFDDVQVRRHSRQLHLPRARDFFRQYVHGTPLIAMLSEVDPARVTALEDEVVAGWQPWSNEHGMTCEQTVNVATTPTRPVSGQR